MERLDRSAMVRPATVTARLEGFSRAPPHAAQLISRMYPPQRSRAESVSASSWRLRMKGMTPSYFCEKDRTRPKRLR